MSDKNLWSGLALVDPLGAYVSGDVPRGVGGVSIDTRTLAAGDLFVAIMGENADGHDFVRAAFDKGAAAAVIDEAHFDALRGSGPLYVVKDTLKALEGLGRAARTRSTAGVVAVTGSVGKTGTKEMLRLALGAFGRTHASVASYNNHWGVPLTLARMPQGARFGVFEIGMNHAGEITPLVGMVRPRIAIITTIAPVHLEAFDSLEGIADAKAEIFSGLEPGGRAIIHRDIPQYERLLDAAHESRAGRILSFGEHPDADAVLLDVRPAAEGSHVTARIEGEHLSYRIGAPGRHIAMNSLAVLLAAGSLGLDLRKAAAALEAFTAPGGRGQRVTLGKPGAEITVIDESYNANPTSMRAALDLLGETPVSTVGRRIAVLGDMLELGPSGPALHAGLAPDVERNQIDRVFAAGPLSRHLFDALPPEKRVAWAPSSAELLPHLLETVGPDDVIMIKGSNGSRMAPIVAALVERFAADADAATPQE